MNRYPIEANFPRHLLLVSLFIFSVLLGGCGEGGGDGSLLSGVTAEAGRLDLGAGVSPFDALSIEYRIGQLARVSARLEGPNGQNYSLRQDEERSPGAYVLRLNGAIDVAENGLTQTRVLPNGDYRYTLTAVGANGTRSEAGGHLAIANSPATAGALEVEGLNATPALISPNFDAREDAALLGWRTTQPATVTVSIDGPADFHKVLTTLKNRPAQEDKTAFNGLDQRGVPVPDGIYTYTVAAADRWGNVTRRAARLEVKGGGKPEAVVEGVTIGPTEILQGGLITVTMRVRNIGKVPIRTQGPDSGFVYSTREVFSSVEGGKYEDKAGYWRVGVDYDSNSGGGASRYPFRWGFGRDLQPGESADITGLIRVDKREEKLRFYVGLIQEQIGLPQDHLQTTEVKISY